MAPQSRKRKSEALEETPQPITPTGSPARKKLKITESQKQALIDNLQLEITERARHLRAHYALQCADLRSRIERRVNRISVAMRKMKMGDLIAKHAEASKPKVVTHAEPSISAIEERPLPPLPQEVAKPASPVRPQIRAPASRVKKRKTSEIKIASDEENNDAIPEQLPVQKKTRGKAAVVATTSTRAVSRSQKPTSVLSPRFHNSRTLPRSPIKEWNSPTKPLSPTKSMIARPVSPLKPASPLKSVASAATSALSAAAHGMFEHAKRGTAATAGKLSRTASREKTTTATTAKEKGKMLPPPRPAASVLSSPQRIPSGTTVNSDSSTTSTNTTVVTKKTRGRPAATKKSSVTTKIAEKASALKTSTKTVNKKVVVAEPAAGRGVLRKRN